MTIIRAVLCVCVLLVAGTASAQTHPCDALPVSITTTEVGQAFRVGWCYPNTPELEITQYRIYRNGVLVTAVAPIPAAPNSQGLSYQEVTLTERAPGNFTYAVSAVNRTGEGPRGVPLDLEVKDVPAVPVVPSKTRILR